MQFICASSCVHVEVIWDPFYYMGSSLNDKIVGTRLKIAHVYLKFKFGKAQLQRLCRSYLCCLKKDSREIWTI